MKKSILTLVVFKVVGINSLVYTNLVGLKGFYKEIFRQKLVVII